MYLKRIELFGFKSFAEKAALDLGPGITAVVGPNGSGKSNITEAIRWALGEQSPHELRGAKMEDVIFAGTDRRRPFGYAEVSVTLDNSDGAFPLDYGEITVTRRVDRSGEGEYFINKVPCRLKDVHDLFADTGIGRQAYSFIGQGKIDEMLLARPEERRAMFEEAAGIVRYKTRKREAQRKLEETAVALTRLQDLIGELTGQVDELAVQSERAERFLGYQSELERLEIQALVVEVRAARAAWQQAQTENEGLRRGLAETEASLAQAEGELEARQAAASALESSLNRLQADLLELSSQVEKARGKLTVLEEKGRGAQEDETRLQAELASLEERQQRLTAQAAALEQQRQGLRIQAGEQEAAIAAGEAEVARLAEASAAQGQEQQRLQEKALDLTRRIADRKNWLGSGEQGVTSVKERLAEAEAAQTTNRQMGQEMDGRLSELQADLDEGQAGREELRQRRVELETGREHAAARRAKLDQEERETRSRLQSLDGRLHLLEELHQGHEGYAQGVRRVLQAALPGILGAVAELIQVPEGYEKAVETALGGGIQNLVARTEADSRRAIDWLKRENAGRATFLPLDLMRPRQEGNLRGLDGQGIIGLAVDLVSFDETIRPAVASLLGRVVVAQDLKAAVRFAKANDLRVRVVTLDGDLLSPGGAMSGGSAGSGRSSGLLSRERERQEVQAEVARLQARLESLAGSLGEAEKKREALEQESAAAAQSLHELDLRQAGVSKDLDRLREERGRAMRQADEAALIAAQLAAQLAGSQRLAAQWSVELQKLETEYAAAVQTQEAAAQAVRQLTLEREAAAAELTDRRVQAAGLAQLGVGLGEQVQRAAAEGEELAAEVERKREELSRLATRRTALQAEAAASSRELDGWEGKRAQAGKEQQALARQRSLDLETSARLEKQIRQARKQAGDLSARLHSSELSETQHRVASEAGIDRLFDQFQVSYLEAQERVAGLPEGPQQAERTAALRGLIEALGPVNTGAIEEYRRLSERFEFLQRQEADLKEARGALDRVIAEMDERIKERFAQAFQQIRTAFQETFTTLFGGGRADLILVDPANLLETGIEVVAQPPGKKLQTLSLLSGGEKSLTAIALVFAMLRVKPTPFCILDEIEAALDDANVDRFSRALSEFGRSTQFIVVTHQKGTMAKADVLWGVSMEDKGVSRLLSVRLADVEGDGAGDGQGESRAS
ncbi:MAG: chromosome segregation protein SMC [Symbiobacteriia bacterium]